MKNFILLLFSFALLVATGCGNKQTTDPPASDQVEYVQALDVQQAAVSTQLDAPVLLVQDQSDPGLSAPEASYNDILNLPKKGDDPAVWIRWIIGVAVVVVYELSVRKITTTKSISIFGLIYRLLNFLFKDKSLNGTHEITPVQKE